MLPFDARFLEHEVQTLGMVAVHEEDAVIARRGRIGPQTVAHHIGFRHRPQGFGGANIDIAAGHQRAKAVGSGRHDAFVERKLEREERLIEALAACPTKHGDGQQHLAAGRIGRQAATLTAGVQEDAFFARQPFVKVFSSLGEGSFFEQPSGTAAAAQFAVDGIGGTEIFSRGQVADRVETVHDIGGER